MAVLRIPDSEVAVLRKMAELNDVVFSALLKAAGETKTDVIYSDFSDILGSAGLQPNLPELKPIIRTIANLYSVMINRDKKPEEIASDLIEGIELRKTIVVSDEEKIILKNRLQKILSVGKLIGLTAKAFDVMTEQDHAFGAVRVLSDIRPVFQENVDSISAAVVIHTLRIAYHQHGEHREFSVALTSDDIKKVAEEIERAKAKEKTLKSFIRKSSVTIFEDKQD